MNHEGHPAVPSGHPSCAPPQGMSILYGEQDPSLCREEVLADIFAATVRNRPGHPALVDGERTLTYAQADAAAAAIAGGLLRRGVGPGDVVGLWMPRGIDLLVAQLAITRTGAAWLPFDADAPSERVAACLADARARGVITTPGLGAGITAPSCALWTMAELEDPDGARCTARSRGAAPDHPAYLIYTSGSTGMPKGIVVTHRNICHYLRSANRVFGFRAEDVVFQGASAAFDLAMEEIWISYLVGATLRVADAETIGDTERLADVIGEAGITVLDTVPTLLTLLPRDVPSLRLIILGGEVCPVSLVQRWSRPGRRIFNSYGPTETTVVATIADVSGGEAVTIGTPIPNYTCYVVDEALEPVPPGTIGQLLIGGPGVTRGYLGRPDLNAQAFIRNPFAEAGCDPLLFRSGDAVGMDACGHLVFHGRIDDQVKIRGFRIELGEIESRLTELPGIAQAAVLARDHFGIEQLVAFLVPAAGGRIDLPSLRTGLRDKLPAYMVPSHFEVIEALPRLPSGKADRAMLRGMVLRLAQDRDEGAVDLGPTEAALHAAWSVLFPTLRVRITDDFFLDLGGHSLSAARLVSQLRDNPRFCCLSLQDLYRYRSIAALARIVDADGGRRMDKAQPVFHRVPRRRFALCAAAQALALAFVYGLFAVPLIAPFLAYASASPSGGPLLGALAALAAFALLLPAIMVLAVGAKWIVIGRVRAGHYPLWGSYYFRWWLVNKLLSVIPTDYLAGTPLQALYLRLLGARIGAHVHLGKLGVAAPDLLAIGDHASIGNAVAVHNCTIEDGLLKIAPVSIGPHCHVGSSAVLMGGSSMAAHAALGDLSCLSAEARIGEAEFWAGSPAQPAGRPDHEGPARPAPVTRRTERIYAVVFAACLLLFAACMIVPLLPVLAIFAHWSGQGAGREFANLIHVPALGLLYVVVLAMQIVALRWMLLPRRVKAGAYPVYSAFYVRKWFVDQLMELSLQLLHPLYASIYLPSWLRMLGVKVGRRAEISTAASITHDLLEIGPESFIADAATLGDAAVRGGWLILKQTRTGARSFVGNSALVPDGYAVPDHCLLGVLSTPPPAASMAPGSTWFGTPSLLLPKREVFDCPSEGLTFRPTLPRIVARAAIELGRIVLPASVMILLAVLLITVMFAVGQVLGPAAAVLLLPALYVGLVALPAGLFTIACKWLVIGRYRPVERPMWTPFVWRSEAVTSVFESLAVPVFLAMMRGTPFLPIYLRALGARIGRRVYLDTTDLTEFDLVRIGDDAALNDECAVQTHLFEDRIMKTGRVDIGNRAVLGPHAVALYGSAMAQDCRLGPLSLVMKGERLPARSSWTGSPARRAQPTA